MTKPKIPPIFEVRFKNCLSDFNEILSTDKINDEGEFINLKDNIIQFINDQIRERDSVIKIIKCILNTYAEFLAKLLKNTLGEENNKKNAKFALIDIFDTIYTLDINDFILIEIAKNFDDNNIMTNDNYIEYAHNLLHIINNIIETLPVDHDFSSVINILDEKHKKYSETNYDHNANSKTLCKIINIIKDNIKSKEPQTTLNMHVNFVNEQHCCTKCMIL